MILTSIQHRCIGDSNNMSTITTDEINIQQWKKFKISNKIYIQFSSVQSLSRVRLFATPWTAARQASLSTTNSQSSLKLYYHSLIYKIILYLENEVYY